MRLYISLAWLRKWWTLECLHPKMTERERERMVYYGSYSYPYSYPNPYVGRREPSIFDGFTLRPLPYPVLLILIVISLFLGIKFYTSYEEAEEAAESQINWLLLALPLAIIFAVRWLSSFQAPVPFFDRRKWAYGGLRGPSPVPGSCQGGSPTPWGVAALIVLLLVLVQYQSIFLDSWFI